MATRAFALDFIACATFATDVAPLNQTQIANWITWETIKVGAVTCAPSGTGAILTCTCQAGLGACEMDLGLTFAQLQTYKYTLQHVTRNVTGSTYAPLNTPVVTLNGNGTFTVNGQLASTIACFSNNGGEAND